MPGRFPSSRKGSEGRRTTYLRNQDLVAGSDAHGQAFTLLIKGTGPNGKDLGLVLLLDAALRKKNARGSLGLGLDALDQDAVKEGGEVLDVAEGRLEAEISTMMINV